MTTRARRKSRDGFASFTPHAPTTPRLPRAAFAGIPPAEAARRLVAFHAQHTRMRDVTRTQKQKIIASVLTELATRGHDLATVTDDDVRVYREWLAELVKRGDISTSYASHIAASWNATMRATLGETAKPGDGLIMKGFPQRPRRGQRLSEQDYNALLAGAHRRRYRSPHDREAFITYLEMEWPAGARPASIRNAVFADVDYERMTLTLRHMKNKEEGDNHEIVLTPRACARIKWMEDRLRHTELWRGRDRTPIICGASGEALTTQALNRMLKGSAALAGLPMRVWNYLLRKSAGTHIGRHNPRLAAEQLGITMKVFEQHYNMPTVDDRIERRELLPGSTWTPRSPEELVGHAHLERARGRIGDTEFREVLDRAERMRGLPGRAHSQGVDPYA